MTITKPQLARLQTCCSQMAQRVAGFDGSRDARLAWAAGILGHAVESFSKLTSDEGRRLIDAAQGEIGHRAPLKPGQRRSPRAARRHGLDGRKDDTEFAGSPEIVSAADLANIRERYERLGMDRDRFEAWLRSSHSPLRGRRAQIRTKADANRVLWALKGMLQDKGLWADWTAA